MQGIFEKLTRYFVGNWHLSVLDLKNGRWTVEPKSSNIPYLKAENANGRHILIQPLAESFYLMADDLTWDTICLQHKDTNGHWKPGRMVVETSPHNYQVWIHSSRPLNLDEKRFWLKKLKSDPGSDPNHRWGRCPGFRNRKEKYCNTTCDYYPLSRLIWIDWRNKAQIPQRKYQNNSESNFSHQPLGGVCHKNPIFRENYQRGDESATDFAFALALVRRGYSKTEIMNRILAERKDWSNHRGPRRRNNYLQLTVEKAKNIVGVI